MNREYFYEVDANGELTLNGVIQDAPWFVDAFYRRLALSANGDFPEYPFVSRCGDEMNYLRPRDSAIVFTRLQDGRLVYADSLTVRFDPEKLAFSDDGVLYHQAPVGEWGRCVAKVAIELAKQIETWGPWFAFINADGRRVVIPPLQQSSLQTLLRPRADNHCVGCGGGNMASLQLSFLLSEQEGIVRSWFTPDATMQGALGTVHGGFVSLLLDEVMGKSLTVRSIKAATAHLEVDFRSPMTVGKQHTLESTFIESQGRKHIVEGKISQPDGTVVATSRGLFVSPRSNVA